MKGWALTDSALLVTLDGGAGWTDLAPGQTLEGVTDVFFLSDTELRLAGVSSSSPGMLMTAATADGGDSWRKRVIETSALAPGRIYIDARLHFLDRTHGWLLGRVATSTAFSVAELLRTSDGGKTWGRLPPPPAAGRFVFVDSDHGFMTGAPVSERLYRTHDGGRSWEEVELSLPVEQGMALYDLPTFLSPAKATLAVTLRGEGPRALEFVTLDSGNSWLPSGSMALPPGDYDSAVPIALAERSETGDIPLVAVRTFSVAPDGSSWALIAEGGCTEGSCQQVTRLVDVDKRSPTAGPTVDHLVRTLKGPQFNPEQKNSSEKTALSLDLGFDKCAAGTTTQMRAWWDNSPYRDANIYFGGAARACSQIHLDADWVATVFEQGWQLIPTWVGPQAPCTRYSRRISSNPGEARTDAVAEAGMAVAAAANLGLGPGTPLYYDVEYYDENDQECSAAMREFIDAWTTSVNDLGYLAGAYGNARNIQNDWIPGVINNPPDAVWLVPWVCGRTSTCDWTPTVFGVPGLDDSYWSGYRRIRQYWGPHTETYGGVSFEIDADYANGPVAAAADNSSCWEAAPAGHWQGEYFDTTDLSGQAVMVRDDGDGTLEFERGSESPGAPCGLPTDAFSARWTRSAPFVAGIYRFTLTAADGVRLLIDGSLEIDQWSDQPPTQHSVLVTLSDGVHTIRFDHFSAGNGTEAELSWKRLANMRRVRPNSRIQPGGKAR